MSIKFDFEKNAKEVEEFKSFIEENKDEKGSLMAILHKAQGVFGYLPEEIQTMIAKETGISLAEIYGVVTFYSHFSLVPKGENEISVCLGTVCYVRGAQKILEEVQRELDISVGETTRDLKFSLEPTRCIGACGLAPVMTVNDDVYGRLVPEDIKGIIEKYRD